jgi:hypothetical protein
MINKQFVFSVNQNDDIENDTEDFCIITVINDRPSTELGSLQGDHVSAYVLIKQSILTAFQDCSIDMAINNLFTMIAAVKTQKTDCLDIGELKNEIDKIKTLPGFINEDLTNIARNSLNNFSLIISLLKKEMGFNSNNSQLLFLIELVEKNKNNLNQLGDKIKYAIRRSNYHYFENLAVKFANNYIKLRNKKEYAAFPREGNVEPPPGEGSRIKVALKILREIANSVTESGEQVLENHETQEIIAKNIFELFWFPKIPDNILITPDKPKKWKKWQETWSNKYKNGVLPRNNDLTILSEVTVTHIELIFSCFPVFYATLAIRTNIIRFFLEQISSKGKITGEKVPSNWGMNKSEQNSFFTAIVKKLPIYLREGEYNDKDEENSEIVEEYKKDDNLQIDLLADCSYNSDNDSDFSEKDLSNNEDEPMEDVHMLQPQDLINK